MCAYVSIPFANPDIIFIFCFDKLYANCFATFLPYSLHSLLPIIANDLPFNISDYIKNDTIHMSSKDLIKESEFVDEGVDATANINGEEIKINSNKGVI